MRGEPVENQNRENRVYIKSFLEKHIIVR